MNIRVELRTPTHHGTTSIQADRSSNLRCPYPVVEEVFVRCLAWRKLHGGLLRVDYMPGKSPLHYIRLHGRCGQGSLEAVEDLLFMKFVLVAWTSINELLDRPLRLERKQGQAERNVAPLPGLL